MSVENTQSSIKEQQPQIEKKSPTEQAQKPRKPEQQHTPEEAPNQGKNMDKLLNKVPNMAPEGALGTETKGPLSAVGDPLGQILNYGLKPLGHVTGAIGNPNGEALLKVRRVAEHEGVADGEPKYLPHQDNGKPDSELPGGVRIGGKKIDGENPLGL